MLIKIELLKRSIGANVDIRDFGSGIYIYPSNGHFPHSVIKAIGDEMIEMDYFENMSQKTVCYYPIDKIVRIE